MTVCVLNKTLKAENQSLSDTSLFLIVREGFASLEFRPNPELLE